jgi:putative heme-binding domain-containing protein
VKLAHDPDAAVRRASLEALRLLRDDRAVPLAVAALADRQTTLAALEYLSERGGPDQAAAIAELAKHTPSAEVLAAAVRVLTTWQGKEGVSLAQRGELDRAVSQVHGTGGLLVRWNVKGPLSEEDAAAAMKDPGPGWRPLFATGTESRLNLGPAKEGEKGVWLAATDLAVGEAVPVEFLASSSGTLQVWLNGRSLHKRERSGSFQIDSDRFSATLAPGVNRLVVQVGSFPGTREFHLRYRRKSNSAEHEKLTQAALARLGNAERGRKVFLDAEKSLCLKCHRVGDQGERIGPELTGIGSRFARAYIIESILEPSRTIAPSYGSLAVSLKNGKVITGVKVAETATTLTLADNQAQKHELLKSDIEEQQSQPLSTMPEGLEKRLTQEEFIDLIAFLVSQKETRAR